MCEPYRSQDDRQDDNLARSLREEFGEMQWLVSWTRLDDGAWLARLSGPGVSRTVEAVGPSRCEAIRDASSIAAQVLDLAR
ncbi:MAG: hypothetical protein ABI353_03770 [Isosphaeraceae bacterium]